MKMIPETICRHTNKGNRKPIKHGDLKVQSQTNGFVTASHLLPGNFKGISNFKADILRGNLVV